MNSIEICTLTEINKNLARIAKALEESNQMVKDISGERD